MPTKTSSPLFRAFFTTPSRSFFIPSWFALMMIEPSLATANGASRMRNVFRLTTNPQRSGTGADVLSLNANLATTNNSSEKLSPPTT